MWKHGGYLAVFGLCIGAKFLTLMLLLMRLELFSWKTKQLREQNEKRDQTVTKRHLLSLLNIKEIQI